LEDAVEPALRAFAISIHVEQRVADVEGGVLVGRIQLECLPVQGERLRRTTLPLAI
jgi:hypothetical protein